MALHPWLAWSVLTVLAVCAPARAAVFGFVSPDDPRSAAALQAHGAALGGVMPVWLQTLGDGAVQSRADPAGEAAARALRGAAPLWPVVQNAALGVWHGAEVGAMLQDPARRAAFLNQLAPQLAALHARGVVFDLEEVPPAAQSGYRALLGEARAKGWRVAVAAPCCDAAWDLRAYGQAADLVIVMIYDLHWPGGEPGPIAALPWFSDAAKRAAVAIPKKRLAIALASYAYDWPKGGTATPLSIPDALARAKASGTAPVRDPASGELHFSYRSGAAAHTVWLPDAQATRGQIAAGQALGVQTFALSRLGLEDPALWPALAALKAGRP